MATAHLTEKRIRDLPVPAAGSDITWDDEVRGLGVRAFASGRKIYLLDYRVGGRQRRYTIGDVDDWPLNGPDGARERAREIKRGLERGEDPLAERQDRRDAATVSDLIDEYLDLHVPTLSPDWAATQKSMLERFVRPEWGSRAVADITSADVAKLLAKVAKGRPRPRKDPAAMTRARVARKARARPPAKPRPTPVMANRVGALLSKMFGLAVEWKRFGITENPAANYPTREEIPRENPLSPADLDRFLDALARAEDRTRADAAAMLLLTGARRSEVFGMQWAHVDLARRVWTTPAPGMKRRKVHTRPLSTAAVALLARREATRGDSPYVFPGQPPKTPDEPHKPIREIRRFWAAVLKDAGLDGVTRHDLRHTFASVLASDGLALQHVGALLHHTSMRTTQRYAHLYVDPLRDAAEAIGRRLAPKLRLVGGTDVDATPGSDAA